MNKVGPEVLDNLDQPFLRNRTLIGLKIGTEIGTEIDTEIDTLLANV